jgi:hypothetical protein
MLRALAVTRWETLTGLICAVTGILAFAANPEIRTVFLGGLLLWQSSLYLSAPYYSLLSVYEKPNRREAEEGTPILESRAAKYVYAIICLLIFGAAIVQLLPRPDSIPAYIRFLPIEIPLRLLLGIH